jgi:hypothetical protein
MPMTPAVAAAAIASSGATLVTAALNARSRVRRASGPMSAQYPVKARPANRAGRTGSVEDRRMNPRRASKPPVTRTSPAHPPEIAISQRSQRTTVEDEASRCELLYRTGPESRSIVGPIVWDGSASPSSPQAAGSAAASLWLYNSGHSKHHVLF